LLLNPPCCGLIIVLDLLLNPPCCGLIIVLDLLLNPPCCGLIIVLDLLSNRLLGVNYGIRLAIKHAVGSLTVNKF
jgi:hypothetical protein